MVQMAENPRALYCTKVSSILTGAPRGGPRSAVRCRIPVTLVRWNGTPRLALAASARTRSGPVAAGRQRLHGRPDSWTADTFGQ